jgi:glycosyltransferase involved in cell wall biosynthesis
VVTNGYDLEELNNVEPHPFGHFAIVYTGSFYPPKRAVSPLMAALKLLKQSSGVGEWYFHYYGQHGAHVREEANRFGVVDQVIVHGNVPRREALSAVRGAGVTAVITTVAERASLEDKGWVPAKVYEAIGLGCPTVLIAPDDSDAETIAQTTGLQRFPGHDIAGISSYLANGVRGRLPSVRNREMYGWTTLAKKLDSLLRGVASRPPYSHSVATNQRIL